MTDLKEAHGRAIEMVYTPEMFRTRQEIIRVYLESMQAQGYRLLPVEAQDEMLARLSGNPQTRLIAKAAWNSMARDFGAAPGEGES